VPQQQQQQLQGLELVQHLISRTSLATPHSRCCAASFWAGYLGCIKTSMGTWCAGGVGGAAWCVLCALCCVLSAVCSTVCRVRSRVMLQILYCTALHFNFAVVDLRAVVHCSSAVLCCCTDRSTHCTVLHCTVLYCLVFILCVCRASRSLWQSSYCQHQPWSPNSHHPATN
jgi:hypothetical protein